MKRILVVDDEPDLVAVLSSILVSEGYEVHAAHDGREAIERAGELRPDLVILDYTMPGLNGAAVGDALRADRRTRGIKILMSSSLSESAVRPRFADYDAYARKPYDVGVTLAVIADLVEN
jgi:chemosensory pili system protein ChpA (sensor histidine kinase/response regulator)